MSIEDLKRFFTFEADETKHIDDIVALLEIRPISAAAARPPLRPFGDTAPAGIHGKTMKPHTVYRPCGQHDCCRSRRKSRRI